MTHICVSELTIIRSDNGLSPRRRQAIIWNNDILLLIELLDANFSEISIGIQTFSFKKMHFNMSSAKWRPFFSRPQWVNVAFKPAFITWRCINAVDRMNGAEIDIYAWSQFLLAKAA